MYCRNCGNEVHDKAIACPKCGVNPRSEKKFCPSCGVETNPNQVVCTACGVSLADQSFSFDTSSLQRIDFNSFLKNKPALFALIALIGCFLPWIKVSFIVSMSLNVFGLSKVVDMEPETILVSFLLYLFPLSLLGVISSDYVPQIAKYKKVFLIAALLLIIYAAIGLFLTASQSDAKEVASVGFGFYVSLAATIASFVFSNRQQ